MPKRLVTYLSHKADAVISHTHFEELSGAVVSRLDYCAGDPGSISTGAEFPTGIQFWAITQLGTISSSTSLDLVLGR